MPSNIGNTPICPSGRLMLCHGALKCGIVVCELVAVGVEFLLQCLSCSVELLLQTFGCLTDPLPCCFCLRIDYGTCFFHQTWLSNSNSVGRRGLVRVRILIGIGPG
jgi:hypothetical protein